jgi:hypothetical protein
VYEKGRRGSLTVLRGTTLIRCHLTISALVGQDRANNGAVPVSPTAMRVQTINLEGLG